jgi:hypothetical protein
MAERCKQGLCYNCDEPYVQGHKCARLFYLEAADYIVEEPPEDDDGPDAPVADATFDPDKPMISLVAIVGIRTEDTMQVYVQLGNHQFVALLDSGSTHNFVQGDVARRLCSSPCLGTGVIVANGDRVECSGLACDVASASLTSSSAWIAT